MTSFVFALSTFVCCFLVMTLVQSAKVCPGYGFVYRPENCESSCSVPRDECPSNTKCCFRVEQPCGFHCVTAKDNQAKAGQCPSVESNVIDSPYWGICDGHFCDVDNDCPDEQKCCSNPCGSAICISPSAATAATTLAN